MGFAILGIPTRANSKSRGDSNLRLKRRIRLPFTYGWMFADPQRPLLYSRVQEETRGYVGALDYTSEKWRWRAEVNTTFTPLGVLGGIIVCAEHDAGYPYHHSGLIGLDTFTGKRKWADPGHVKLIEGFGECTLKEGRIYQTTSGGVRCMDMQTGKVVWSHQVGPSGPNAWPHAPAVGKTALSTQFAVNGRTHVVCLRQRDGHVIWQTSYPGVYGDNPANDRSVGPMVSIGGSFVGIVPRKGHPKTEGLLCKWNATSRQTVWQIPVLSQEQLGTGSSGTIIVRGKAETLVGYRGSDGNTVWTYANPSIELLELKGRCGNHLVTHAKTAESDWLFGIVPDNGKREWQHQVGRRDAYTSEVACGGRAGTLLAKVSIGDHRDEQWLLVLQVDR